MKYVGAMKELLEKGFAEKVPSGQVGAMQRMHYLLHHPVINPNKPKLRIVFDCAAKGNGPSLNEQVWTGPDLTNKLIGVLLRFKEENIALVADISSMFHQIYATPSHRDMLRFLWWTDGDENKTAEIYRMKVQLFGGTWSPSCTSYALRHVAIDHKTENNEEACKTIERNFYVDDFMKSTKTEADVILLVHKLIELLEREGFALNKWLSNSRIVLQSIPPDKRA